MSKELKPTSDCPAIRVVMMPRDTNPEGTIFGGVILSLIDQAAYVEAIRQRHHTYVTVAINGVEFHEPVEMGDVLSLYADATHAGRTSMTIHVRVLAARRSAPDVNIKVTEADVIFVAIDDTRKPIPIFG